MMTRNVGVRTLVLGAVGLAWHGLVQYRNEGCDPSKVKDAMWWLGSPQGAYEPYGPKEYELIVSKKAKL